jgi:hypothetical protein
VYKRRAIPSIACGLSIAMPVLCQLQETILGDALFFTMYPDKVLWDVQMGDNLIRIDSFFPDHPTDELLTWLSGYNVKLDTDSIRCLCS